jgi:hypothetical protein
VGKDSKRTDGRICCQTEVKPWKPSDEKISHEPFGSVSLKYFFIIQGYGE